MDALSTVTLLPGTKSEIDSYYVKAKQELLEGNRDPLTVLKQLKAYKELIESLLKDKEVEELILEEAEKYGEKRFDHDGAEFEIKDVGVKYDFYATGDSKWEELKQKEDQVAKERKEREQALKAHKDSWVDPDTGEVINPPVKKGQTKVVVKLK